MPGWQVGRGPRKALSLDAGRGWGETDKESRYRQLGNGYWNSARKNPFYLRENLLRSNISGTFPSVLATSRRGNLLMWIARVGIVFLATCLFVYLVYITSYITQWPEGPAGCDAYGYLRQAQLIREHGPIRGLDTSIESPVADALVRAAKATTLPASAWYLAVAPGCTYYNENTDRIVLQFPPGTGMIYALFPETIQVRATAIASATLLFLLSSVAAFYSRSWQSAVGILSVGALAVVTLTHEGNGLSVWPSMVAAAITAWLTVKALDAIELKSSLAWLGALGFVLGLATNIRLGNGFILFGILAAMAVVNRHRIMSTVILLLAAGAGALPNPCCKLDRRGQSF
jgi:hypothetical protein